jgi:hypothetical protein
MRLALALCLLGRVAVAAEPTVKVQVDVVLASTAKGEVDPSLSAMQQTLSSRVKYLSLKKLSSLPLTLTTKPQPVELPGKRVAEVSLTLLKQDVATVRVKIAPSDTTYTLGHEKSLYVQAGEHSGADLWLVVSQPK